MAGRVLHGEEVFEGNLVPAYEGVELLCGFIRRARSREDTGRSGMTTLAPRNRGSQGLMLLTRMS